MINKLLKLCEEAGEELDPKDIERLEAAKDSKKALEYAKNKDKGFNATTYAAMKTDADKEKYKREVPGAADVIAKTGGKLESRNRFFVKGHGRKRKAVHEKKCTVSRARQFFEENTILDEKLEPGKMDVKVESGGAKRFFESNIKIDEVVPDRAGPVSNIKNKE
ncbi:MAG: hypothetical protein WDA47_06910 [Bacilli bacterium]|jgi:hypothetical protein